MQIINSNPSPYPDTTNSEISSVITFVSLLDGAKVIPDVKFLDKIPNTDGIVELINESRHPIGKLEIQIKTLEKKNSNKPKFQCDLPFLSYCEHSILPVVLVVVDAENKIAYWRHISRSFLLEIKDKIKGKSVNVSLPKENIVSLKNDKYYDDWKHISSEYQRRIVEYDELKKDLDIKSSKINELSKHYYPQIGSKNDEFKIIHSFLDSYNSLLDGPFSLIKSLFGKEIWKFGIVYSEFTKSSVSYSLYPIYSNYNDVQIYIVEDEKELKKKGWKFIKGMYGKNEIYERPKEYSYQLIAEHISEMLKKRVFYFYNLILAREYIYAFVDRYIRILPIEQNVITLSIADIKQNVIDYIYFLSSKSHIAFKLNNDEVYICDLEDLAVYGTQKHIEEIQNQFYKLDKNVVVDKRIEIKSGVFDFRYLVHVVERLIEDSVETVDRVHPIHQIPNKPTYYEYEVYGNSELKATFEIIHKDIPGLFYNFILEYFPELVNEIDVFPSINRIIYVIKQDNSSVDFYQLQNLSNVREKKIDIFHSQIDSVPEIFNGSINLSSKLIQFDGNSYIIKSYGFSVLRTEFKRLPIMNYLYKKLGEAFKKYFTDKGVNIKNNYFGVNYI